MWAHADVLPLGPLRGSHPFPATAGSARGWYVQGRVRPSGRGPGRCYLPTARGSILSGSSPAVKPGRLSQNLWRVSEQLKCKMISNQSNSWMGRQGAWPRPMGLGSAPPRLRLRLDEGTFAGSRGGCPCAWALTALRTRSGVQGGGCSIPSPDHAASTC